MPNVLKTVVEFIYLFIYLLCVCVCVCVVVIARRVNLHLFQISVLKKVYANGRRSNSVGHAGMIEMLVARMLLMMSRQYFCV